MDRWGCIRFPELPLQVALLRRSGEENPFAVVRDEKPSSPLLFVNAEASKQGLRAGMRYAAALSVVPTLRVDTVSSAELSEVRRAIVELLAEWSPRIEPCSFDDEVFWIDASGLSAIHGAPERWGASLRDHLASLGYRIDLVIGFTRRGSYVLVRSWRRSGAVANVRSERRAVAESAVEALPLSWPLRDLLAKLGVRTVAEFDRVPAVELSRRLGKDALTSLNGLGDLPLQPAKLAVPNVLQRLWDEPVSDLVSLSEALIQLLGEALGRLRPKARLVESLTFDLVLEDGIHTEVLKPAQATASVQTWSRLIELRLSSMTLTAGVVGVRLDADSVPPAAPAGDLFDRPPRDLTRGEKALALIRARWGDDVVVRAVAADSHAPELSYVWSPVQRLTAPQPRPGVDTGVRRVFHEPLTAPGEAVLLAGPFLYQSSDGTLLRRHWFVREGNQTLWLRQDGWAEPRVVGAVD